MTLHQTLKDAINLIEDYEACLNFHNIEHAIHSTVTLTDLRAALDGLEYDKLPPEKKPRCKAKSKIIKGKLYQCKRSAAHGSKYCYSHREWNQ